MSDYILLLLSRFHTIVHFGFLIFAISFHVLISSLIKGENVLVTQVIIILGVVITVLSIVMPSKRMISIMCSTKDRNLIRAIMFYNFYEGLNDFYLALSGNIFLISILVGVGVDNIWSQLTLPEVIVPALIFYLVYIVLPSQQLAMRHFGYDVYDIKKILGEEMI